MIAGTVIGDDEDEFEPSIDSFPTFSRAMRYFNEKMPARRQVRFESRKSYDQVFGAESGSEIPLAAQNENQKSWEGRDGLIYASVAFCLPNGEERVATTNARPMVDDRAAQSSAAILGIDVPTFLGVLPQAARLATSRQLISDTVSVVNEALDQLDDQGTGWVEIAGQDTGWADIAGESPVIKTTGAQPGTATIAALMWLEQRAQQGDPQAAIEWSLIQGAASTDLGKQVALPVLIESSRRLAKGRTEKRGR
jgi:hypothetical protein